MQAIPLGRPRHPRLARVIQSKFTSADICAMTEIVMAAAMDAAMPEQRPEFLPLTSDKVERFTASARVATETWMMRTCFADSWTPAEWEAVEDIVDEVLNPSTMILITAAEGRWVVQLTPAKGKEVDHE